MARPQVNRRVLAEPDVDSALASKPEEKFKDKVEIEMPAKKESPALDNSEYMSHPKFDKFKKPKDGK